MLGGVLASLGMVTSSFCRTLSQLYFAAGFIAGECHFHLKNYWAQVNRAGKAPEVLYVREHVRERDNEQINKKDYPDKRRRRQDS